MLFFWILSEDKQLNISFSILQYKSSQACKNSYKALTMLTFPIYPPIFLEGCDILNSKPNASNSEADKVQRTLLTATKYTIARSFLSSTKFKNLLLVLLFVFFKETRLWTIAFSVISARFYMRDAEFVSQLHGMNQQTKKRRSPMPLSLAVKHFHSVYERNTLFLWQHFLLRVIWLVGLFKTV